MENKWIPREKLEKDMKLGLLYAKSSTKCANCGHSVLIGRKGKCICNWCGHYIFKDKKEEFMYRMGELL